MTKAFSHEYNRFQWSTLHDEIYNKTAEDVEHALSKTSRDLADMQALLSPSAEPYLEAMAQQSQTLTRQRFGHTMQIYAPLYLSNVCSNICTYCGFSINNKLRRKTLDETEILAEANALKQKGIDNILLVTGEAPKTAGADYIENAIRLIKPYFSQISIEVQPLNSNQYQQLIKAGLHGVSLYQETYHRGSYQKHHLKGNKTQMEARLNAPSLIGQQNIHKIGLGVLLGLQDWRIDSLFCAIHLRYLQKHHWRTRFGLSFPRLRPCEGDYQVQYPISDKQLVQLITAWRLFDADLDLTLSTRENENFRDAVCKLGITSMSAESSTQPGGYSVDADKHLQQFEISDDRRVHDIKSMLNAQGLEVIDKDWSWEAPSFISS